LLLYLSYQLGESATPDRRVAIRDALKQGGSLGAYRLTQSIFQSTWLIHTDKSPSDWGEHLKVHFGHDACVVITRIHGDELWVRLENKALEWMKDKV
jgi:hypothetical protein